MSARRTIYLPTPADVEQAKISYRILAEHPNTRRVELTVRGNTAESECIVLPGQVLQILLDVLSATAAGNVTSITFYNQELTTQDAADLLNVSNPFLVNLLENGEIPFRKIGAHLRVQLQDIMDYKESMDRKWVQTLDELAALSKDEDMGY